MRLPKGDARDHWRSFPWNTNIASADVLTLESVNEAGAAGSPSWEHRGGRAAFAHR